MSLHEIPVLELGSIARELLVLEQAASVIGLASRGIYLRLESNWVLFISYEEYPGPLTLNIGEVARQKFIVQPSTTAIVNSQGILFPDSGLKLSMGRARTWLAPVPGTVVSKIDHCRARLADVADRLIANGKTSVYGMALPALFNPVKDVIEDDRSVNLMANIRDALRQGDPLATADALLVFCGQGVGLTPSGDDLIAGFALALNRWGFALAPGFGMEALNREIIKAVYRKTTTLSANLIECAARGQADERMLSALDGIITGEPAPEMCAAYLAEWGHSSGMDALAGMALAI
jgi:hypothetical protein